MSERRRVRAPSMVGKILGLGSSLNHETGGKKRSLSRLASSGSHSDGLGRKRKKEEEKTETETVTETQEDPDFPRDEQGRMKNVIWDRTLLDLTATKNIELVRYTPPLLKIPKKVTYLVQRKKTAIKHKQTVGVAIPAPNDIPARLLLPPIQKGPRLDAQDRIVPHSILRQNFLNEAISDELTLQIASPGTQVPFGTESIIKYRRIPDDSHSRALQYWEHVLTDREHQRSNIIDLTGRPAGEELMGEGRSLSQYKIFERETTVRGLMAHRYSVTNRTGTRGRGFWKQPILLGTDDSGILESITLSDRGHKKQIEYIGVPVPIREEKGYIPTKAIPKVDHDVTHKPNIRELCARGKHPMRGKGVGEDLKHIEEDSNQDRSPSKEVPSIPRLILGGHELSWSDDKREGVVVIAEVGMKGTVGERVDANLEMVNTGATVIFYDWKKIPDTDAFNLKKHTTNKFFFDESNGVILPGQTKHTRASFKSPTAGVYSEKWKLETRPSLCGGGDVQVTVWGIAHAIDVYKDSRQELESCLHERVKSSIARSILDEILRLNLPACTGHRRRGSYRWMFDDAPRADDHFNTINKGFYYHSDVIKTLLAISPEQDGDDSSSEDTGHVAILSLDALKKNLENLPGSCEDRDKFLLMFHGSLNKLWYPVKRPVSEERFSMCRTLLTLTIDGMVITSLRLRKHLGISSESNIPEGIMGKIKTLSKDMKGRRIEPSTVSSGKNSGRRKLQAGNAAGVGSLNVKEVPFNSKHNPLLYIKYREKLYLETYQALGNMADRIASNLAALKTPDIALVKL